MSFTLSRTLSPWLVLGAASLAGCRLDVSLGGAGGGGGAGGDDSTASSVSSGGGPDITGSTTSSVGVGGGTPAPTFTPDKVDLLFVVDNSGSMADKQQVLNTALTDLVQGLTNPPCVDPSGVLAAVQPPSGLDACPSNMSRARSPVQDMHIGVISSSLGGHGANSCTPGGMTPMSNNDKAHLLARSVETSSENDLPTYQNRGFLVWDPAGRHSPAGESNPGVLSSQLSAIVQGVGQAGCGFEAPLESFYRFLIDPEPFDHIELGGPGKDVAVPKGIDNVLLAQRKAFLRPDSLLLIVMLTDENDCSIVDGGRNYMVAQTSNTFRMWRARKECAINPNDPCCKSCSQPQEGCPADPTCTGPDGLPARLSSAEDHVNLRCWDQKRRFGFSFLQPIERYADALTSPTVKTLGGELVPNPIFSDLDPTDDNTRIRGPQHVVFTGIVGVPWQDIARQDANGSPDLLDGLDQEGNPVGGLKSAEELSAPVPGSNLASTWEVILGDPANLIPPKDPFMAESVVPRVGANPITGDTLIHPQDTGWNAINGREYTVSSGGDLQFACIFGLPAERNCVGVEASCDCREWASGTNDNPLCKPAGTNDPAQPEDRTTTQTHAKAYPGLRELHLLQSLGDRGIVGSICPAQMDDLSRDDFGYRPVMKALLDRITPAL